MKSDAQLREEIIRDLPETTDLVERVAIALEREFDRVVDKCNGELDFRAAARAAIAAAALAGDYCGIVEVNEEDFKAEGEGG